MKEKNLMIVGSTCRFRWSSILSGIAGIYLQVLRLISKYILDKNICLRIKIRIINYSLVATNILM